MCTESMKPVTLAFARNKCNVSDLCVAFFLPFCSASAVECLLPTTNGHIIFPLSCHPTAYVSQHGASGFLSFVVIVTGIPALCTRNIRERERERMGGLRGANVRIRLFPLSSVTVSSESNNEDTLSLSSHQHIFSTVQHLSTVSHLPSLSRYRLLRSG